MSRYRITRLVIAKLHFEVEGHDRVDALRNFEQVFVPHEQGTLDREELEMAEEHGMSLDKFTEAELSRMQNDPTLKSLADKDRGYLPAIGDIELVEETPDMRLRRVEGHGTVGVSHEVWSWSAEAAQVRDSLAVGDVASFRYDSADRGEQTVAVYREA